MIGVDIVEKNLQAARKLAESHGVSSNCEFVMTPSEKADVILSMDAFEHFSDPPAILKKMREYVKDDGYALVTFGYTWASPPRRPPVLCLPVGASCVYRGGADSLAIGIQR